MVERLEMQLSELVEDLRRAHPGLEIKRWSHSVAQMTLDGWSFGFVVTGLARPLEFELCVTQAHSEPLAHLASARWQGEEDDSRWEIVNLLSSARLETRTEEPTDPDDEDFLVSKVWTSEARPLAAETILPQTRNDLMQELNKAIRFGPIEPNVTSCSITIDEMDEMQNESLPLNEEESSVLLSWNAHLRGLGYAPIQITAAETLGSSHLSSPGQSRRIAARLDPGLRGREAVVAALLGPTWPNVGPGPVNFDWPRWRDFYRVHPRGHGWMYLYRPGICGDQAVLLFRNFPGLWERGPTETMAVSRLGCGSHLVNLERKGREWQVVLLQHLPEHWLEMTYLELALQIHFDGQMEVLARGGWRLHFAYRGIEIQFMDPMHLFTDRKPFACPQACVLVGAGHHAEAILAADRILEARGLS